MFVDFAEIMVRSGNGGDGAVSFHREKYVAAGGPDGGDGGKGGDIIFQVSQHLNTLVDFRYKTHYVAHNGANGGRNNCSGKSATNTIINLPQGTLVRDKTSGAIIADLSSNESFVVAKGGRGGRGNQHFAKPNRQAPRFAIPGESGVAKDLILELKLLADVGLIGFPNVGKSSLISVISNARPKIANYHFTTLQPCLGVVRIAEGASFVVADIPGLIEGASVGCGLGHNFLRHIERCRMLWHVLDVAALEGRDPATDFNKINNEMEHFSKALLKKPQIIVANKIDAATEEQVEKLKNYAAKSGKDLFCVSALRQEGLEKLTRESYNILKQLPPIKTFEPTFNEDYRIGDTEPDSVEEQDGIFVVKSQLLARALKSADLSDYENLLYFQKMLVKSGIEAKLKKLGIKEKDTVIIDGIGVEFEYQE
ncbi:MAG: GTPase ObgE [Oscillospiraceae bacterium]|jgi:GTP-binding protein|nr:GTPase ObgE [Oscillospiraceae bacterium]